MLMEKKKKLFLYAIFYFIHFLLLFLPSYYFKIYLNTVLFVILLYQSNLLSKRNVNNYNN